MAECDVPTDRARSWIVAACCCFCNLTFYGVSRLSGIMLVAATHTFQVSRASAAVPFSLSTAIRNLAGVFVGHLGHRFGVGPVVAAGCLIASLGSGLCFFAKDMQWLTICWGGIFGFGFGLSTCLLPLAINQNFVKHNGAASGLSYSGAYIGSFIFPPIIVTLLNSYGLQGTFLVISGGVLNVFIAAMLLRERKTKKKYSLKNSLFTCDLHNPTKEDSSECNSTENGEMWKQNINQEFFNSQCNFIVKSDKSNFIPNMYLSNQPYSNQEIFSLEDKSPVKHKNLFHQEIPEKFLNLLPNLFEKFKHENRCLDENTKNKVCKIDSANSTAPFHTFTSVRGPVNISSHPNGIRSGYTGAVAKPVPIASKVCLRKLFDSRLLSKGKYKAKCKLKLQKLKKAIKASLLKYRSRFGGKTDNVTLISFKHLQSFLCHYSYKQNMPYKSHNLTFPHSVLYMPCEIDGNVKCTDFRNYAANAKLNSNTFCPADATGTKKSNVLPILDSLIEYNKSPVFSRNSEITNFDMYVNCKNSYLFQRTRETYNDSVSNNSSVEEDSSCSTKTEDSQSSYIPSSSSEQSLHKMSESKNSSKKSSISRHSKSSRKVAKWCLSDWFHMLREPMFAVIGFTMSIQTFMVVCVVTTIEDYAKDVGIPENRTHYALMALSISNLIGTLTLGSITDRGFISRHRFLSLCFFGMSLSLVAVSLVAVSLPSLLSVVAIYGLLESGVVITFPILTKQFVKGERRQAVAIASSNVLSAPTVMLVPMLIGHFRDNIGCYSGLFHLLGATSFSCCILWLIAPSLCQKKWFKKASVQKTIISRC